MLIGKEEKNISLFADCMIVYIEKSQGICQKILKLLREFSKIIDDKVNTQTSSYFYILAMLYQQITLKTEIKNKILFIIDPKKVKTNLTKHVQHLYKKNAD